MIWRWQIQSDKNNKFRKLYHIIYTCFSCICICILNVFTCAYMYLCVCIHTCIQHMIFAFPLSSGRGWILAMQSPTICHKRLLVLAKWFSLSLCSHYKECNDPHLPSNTDCNRIDTDAVKDGELVKAVGEKAQGKRISEALSEVFLYVNYKVYFLIFGTGTFFSCSDTFK